MAASAKAIGSVKEIFESMEYGPADESRAPLDAWISDHNGKFGHFINNEWVHPEERKYVPSVSPFDKKDIALTLQGTSDDVNVAVNAASNAYKSWNSLSGHERAKYLYSFARTVQKHSRILAVLESLDNGKTIRETRDCDIPLVIRHLYYYAGWAQIMDSELSDWKSIGVVGAIVPWNFPLMLLAWKICPALAAGNTVVLKPATNTRLSALMLAELAAQSGMPKGVFNVITGGGALGSQLASHNLVDKVAFTGSTEIGQLLRRLTAGSGKKLSLELGGKSPVIVFDSADLDSAVEGVVDAIWFNQGQVCSAGSRLFVQESVYSLFIEKLKTRMQTLKLGSPLDKCQDMGPVVSEAQKATIESYVQSARDEGAQVHQIAAPSGCFYPPTLITDVTPSSKCVAEEIFGPVLVAMSFRTAKEAIALANNSIYGLGASVFSEKITLAVETAKHIKSGAVWINAHNLFDAAAGFGGYKQSGFGRDGGKEGMYEYIKPKWQGSLRFTLKDEFNSDKFGSSYKAGGPSSTTPGNLVDGDGVVKVDRTYKLYYGGAQKRPDGNYSRLITNVDGKNYALVGEANRKDVRNAVECAVKAQPSWEKKSGFNRSQILYYIAENLDQRRGDFSKQLQDLTGLSKESCEKEVQLSVSRLFTAASYCDKHGGEIQETTLYGTVIKLHEAMGVIGIACPDASPLLSFVSLTASAIARGNAVVAIPSEKYASVVLAMYQIFETSDLPGGVINILTGSKDHLTKYLTEHHGLQAMWYFGSHEGSRFVEHCSAGNVKRTWVDYGVQRDWQDDCQGQGQEFLYHATQVKNIWLTMGDIFAN